jgi:hypothetical protein
LVDGRPRFTTPPLRAARAAFSASRCWRLLVATTGRPFDLSDAGAAVTAGVVSFFITFIYFIYNINITYFLNEAKLILSIFYQLRTQIIAEIQSPTTMIQ